MRERRLHVNFRRTFRFSHDSVDNLRKYSGSSGLSVGHKMDIQYEGITVLIVDDEPFFRETLTAYLQRYDTITVVATASSGREALKILEKVTVDVVLSDVRMPHLDGIGLVQVISERNLSCRLVALTTFDDEQAMLEMLNFGAYGFVLKSARPGEIVEAVRSAAQGGITISPEAATALRKYITHFPVTSMEALPSREHQVLTLLHMGKNNATIANDLAIAETTVKKTVARLLQRYSVCSRLELVVATGRHGNFNPGLDNIDQRRPGLTVE